MHDLLKGVNIATLNSRKSKKSYTEGCVEVADVPGGKVVAVRDSKDPDGPVLAFEAGAWQRFVNGLRDEPEPAC